MKTTSRIINVIEESDSFNEFELNAIAGGLGPTKGDCLKFNCSYLCCDEYICNLTCKSFECEDFGCGVISCPSLIIN